MGKPKKYEERLMEALGYDEDDLEANQAGHFSEAQQAQFAAEQRRIAAFIVIDTLVVAGWIVGASLLGGIVAATLPLVLLIFPVLAALVLTYAIKLYRLYADAREDRPLSAEGRIEMSMHGKSGAGSTVDCTIQVGGTKFPVKENAFLAFKNGDPYCIYYARRSKRLLSVEWLRENDDNLLPVTDFVTNGDAVDDEADAEIGKLTLRR